MDNPDLAKPSLRARLPRLALRLGMGALVLAVLAALVGGILLLRVDFDAVERAAISRLEARSGFAFRFKERRLSSLPRPQIRYTDVEVKRPDGSTLVSARSALLRLDLIDMLDGTLDGVDLTLTGARASVEAEQFHAPLRSPRAIIDALQAFTALCDVPDAPPKLELRFEDARLALRGGSAEEIGPFAGSLRYAGRSGRIEGKFRQVGLTLQGEATPLARQGIDLSFVLPNRASLSGGNTPRAALDLTWGDFRLAFSGIARAEPDIALAGKVEATLGQSFDQLVDWRKSARDERAEPPRLESRITLDSRGLGFDALTIGVGSRRLTGIASLREVGERWGLSATLGGDLVDGTAAHRVLQGVRDARGAWSNEPLVLNPMPGMDLDLRLSTKAFRLGRFALGKVALSVLTRPGRTEMAILDSRFGEGSFKARVLLAESPDGAQALRFSISGEQIEGGAFLDQALGLDKLSGTGSFVVQAQGQGRSVAALMATLNGTAALDMRDGTLSGIDLSRLMSRAAEQRAETALLFSLVGKTPYEQLRADFTLREGKLEPVGSQFLSRSVHAALEGASDIGRQAHKLAIVLRARDETGEPKSEFFAFRLEGPLLSPSLKPDPSLLQNRG